MVELSGDLADETDLAWKFVPDGEHESTHVWIPKSVGEIEMAKDDIGCTVYVPEWFAKKEGLI